LSYFDDVIVEVDNEVAINENPDGSYSGTTKFKAYSKISKKVKEHAYRVTHRSIKIVKEFCQIFKSLWSKSKREKSQKSKGQKVSDIINETRKELLRRHPDLDEEDILIQLIEELKNMHIVFLHNNLDNKAA